ncbi:UNKNOWN [Stylonychia lemnae]|uniref:Uncharacterized protein n=1 Tax=Stylonychia lemnae TaxID=5949 RepID=A0A078AG81_STYLE|nr:UNKNOWN [Stylonychia lemnae]|eukprot:CDW80502.1 UNKNOWN [Stylonychia lemnae]
MSLSAKSNKFQIKKSLQNHQQMPNKNDRLSYLNGSIIHEMNSITTKDNSIYSRLYDSVKKSKNQDLEAKFLTKILHSDNKHSALNYGSFYSSMDNTMTVQSQRKSKKSRNSFLDKSETVSTTSMTNKKIESVTSNNTELKSSILIRKRYSLQDTIKFSKIAKIKEEKEKQNMTTQDDLISSNAIKNQPIVNFNEYQMNSSSNKINNKKQTNPSKNKNFNNIPKNSNQMHKKLVDKKGQLKINKLNNSSNQQLMNESATTNQTPGIKTPNFIFSMMESRRSSGTTTQSNIIDISFNPSPNECQSHVDSQKTLQELQKKAQIEKPSSQVSQKMMKKLLSDQEYDKQLETSNIDQFDDQDALNIFDPLFGMRSVMNKKSLIPDYGDDSRQICMERDESEKEGSFVVPHIQNILFFDHQQLPSMQNSHRYLTEIHNNITENDLKLSIEDKSSIYKNERYEDSIITFQKLLKSQRSEEGEDNQSHRYSLPNNSDRQSMQIGGINANEIPLYIQLPHNLDLVDAINQFQKYSNQSIKSSIKNTMISKKTQRYSDRFTPSKPPIYCVDSSLEFSKDNPETQDQYDTKGISSERYTLNNVNYETTKMNFSFQKKARLTLDMDNQNETLTIGEENIDQYSFKESIIITTQENSNQAKKIYDTGRTNKIFELQERYPQELSKNCVSELEKYIQMQEEKFGKFYQASRLHTISQESNPINDEIHQENSENTYQIDLDEEEQGGQVITLEKLNNMLSKTQKENQESQMSLNSNKNGQIHTGRCSMLNNCLFFPNNFSS